MSIKLIYENIITKTEKSTYINRVTKKACNYWYLILNTISVIDRDAKSLIFLKNKQTFVNYFIVFKKILKLTVTLTFLNFFTKLVFKSIVL